MATIPNKNSVPIVDLFAGPGGLGEGFSSLEGNPFQIMVSAEMEESAHRTLQLRAYFRLLKRKGEEFLQPYYRFCNGSASLPYDSSSESIWKEAGDEAQRLTLGSQEGNERLDSILTQNSLGFNVPWVLIGGPPCQAYSLVGRSRNKGKNDYKPENDHRHFLYREYLRIIQRYRPAVFVMENVKGILSSSVGGKPIFQTILRDLADPDAALGQQTTQGGYRIHSLTCATRYERAMAPEDINPKDFIVRAEDYGIPQARHRVILLGIRDDIDISPAPLQHAQHFSTVQDAIGELPPLRSRLSRQAEDADIWTNTVNTAFSELRDAARSRKDMQDLYETLGRYSGRIRGTSYGGLRFKKEGDSNNALGELQTWYKDRALQVWLNHESRSHMASDLRRYAFVSAFGQTRARSPAGHAEFDLIDSLHPSHENWKSGKFKDRFKVQLAQLPSTTVTSHISKDGHYFIHPDPAQCRSLTVREAARLQTFPDNYFFQGNRTQQYHQVGNAVPPLLAHKIAKIVKAIIDEHTSAKITTDEY